MGTAKRERQKANRQARLAELEVEETKEAREQTTRRVGTFVAIGAGILALILLFIFLGNRGNDEPEASFAPTPVPQASVAPEAPEPTELLDAVPADFEPWAGAGALSAVSPAARVDAYAAAPPTVVDATKAYSAVLNTDSGKIPINLFPAEAPVAVNNFVSLARDGYYDGVIFHRVLADFMAQAGDPAGIGTGGPGYSFADEFESPRVFDKPGILAMANSGPATNGSQFFITFVPTPHLNGKHTIFGEVAGDPEILSNILLRDPAAGGPATVIESISIVES